MMTLYFHDITELRTILRSSSSGGFVREILIKRKKDEEPFHLMFMSEKRKKLKLHKDKEDTKVEPRSKERKSKKRRK